MIICYTGEHYDRVSLEAAIDAYRDQAITTHPSGQSQGQGHGHGQGQGQGQGQGFRIPRSRVGSGIGLADVPLDECDDIVSDSRGSSGSTPLKEINNNNSNNNINSIITSNSGHSSSNNSISRQQVTSLDSYLYVCLSTV